MFSMTFISMHNQLPTPTGSTQVWWLNRKRGILRFPSHNRLSWRSPTEGETLVEAQAKGSDFRRALNELHPQKNTLLFYVWPDSYDVYLRAREIGYGAGYMAGWVAQLPDAESDWVQATDRFTGSAVSID